MNCCTTGNSYLWILIILFLLGTNSGAFTSSAFTGAGWPMLIAALYVLSKNGTLASIFNSIGACNNWAPFFRSRKEPSALFWPRARFMSHFAVR